MTFKLDNKVTIITGAASGIGKAVATLFVRQGARVHLLDRDRSALDALQSELTGLNGSATAHVCDVSNARSVTKTFGEVFDTEGHLDLLVNNAGIAHIGTVESTSEEQFDAVYAVNVKGVFLCLQAGLPLLLASGGGAIVNLASSASLAGVRERFAYSMSKGAVHTMTLSVAADYVERGIRCNCVCPARIHTPFVDGYLAKHYPDRQQAMFQELSQAQPVGRMGKPDEVAALVLYLCSDEAGFVTGSAYPLDGGATSLIWGASLGQ